MVSPDVFAFSATKLPKTVTVVVEVFMVATWRLPRVVTGAVAVKFVVWRSPLTSSNPAVWKRIELAVRDPFMYRFDAEETRLSSATPEVKLTADEVSKIKREREREKEVRRCWILTNLKKTWFKTAKAGIDWLLLK